MDIADLIEETGLHENTIKMELYGCIQGANFRSASARFAFEVNRNGTTDEIKSADLKLSVAHLAFISYLHHKYKNIRGLK